MSYTIHQGDCREHMRSVIAPASVHCIVTSPPYWALRDYGIAPVKWADGSECVFGLEPTIEAYIEHTLEVFEGIGRVLRPDGVVFWNIGDTFAQDRGGTFMPAQTLAGGVSGVGGEKEQRGLVQGYCASRDAKRQGLAHGTKCLIPHRVAIALMNAGWVVRQDIVGAKASPMPESLGGWHWRQCRVKTEAGKTQRWPDIGTQGARKAGEHFLSEGATAKWSPCPGCPKCEANGGYVLVKKSWRPTNAHEYIFMLTRGMDYFADAENVAEAATGRGPGNYIGGDSKTIHTNNGNGFAHRVATGKANGDLNAGVETRNPRSIFRWSSEPLKSAHFAAYPSTIPHFCIKASISPGGCCDQCGSQYAPIVEKVRVPTRPGTDSKVNGHAADIGENRDPQRHIQRTLVHGYRQTCKCENSQPVPQTVYDPFCGSGTTTQVAHHLGLNAIGSEIAPHYLPIIEERMQHAPKCLRKKTPTKKPPPIVDRQLTLFVGECG